MAAPPFRDSPQPDPDLPGHQRQELGEAGTLHAEQWWGEGRRWSGPGEAARPPAHTDNVGAAGSAHCTSALPGLTAQVSSTQPETRESTDFSEWGPEEEPPGTAEAPPREGQFPALPDQL